VCFYLIWDTYKIDWACLFVSITVLGLAIWDTRRIENGTLQLCTSTFRCGHYYVKSTFWGEWWEKSFLWMLAINGSAFHGDQILIKCYKYPSAALLLSILVTRNLEVKWNPSHHL
jgi:hypothetical protein